MSKFMVGANNIMLLIPKYKGVPDEKKVISCLDAGSTRF